MSGMSQRTQAELETQRSIQQRRISIILYVLFVLGIAMAAFVVTGAAAQASALPQPTPATEPTPTLLLHFAKDITAEERAAVLAELGAEELSWLPQIGVAEVRLMAATADRHLTEMTAVDALNTLTNRWQTTTWAQLLINAIETDAVVTGADLPNDPDLAISDRSYGLSTTHAFEGWEYTRGNDAIIIAVLDTGLRLDHPEFAGRVVAGRDFINSDDEPMDDNGHGTHAAGIATAGIDNGIGMAGICPQCLIMPVKVLNQNNAGTWSSVAKGILHAVDHGARVINLSLGAAVSSQTLEDAIAYAQAHDVLVVAAAGNMGVDRKFYPAALEGVLAVSATDSQDKHWNLSNYGDYIDVAAPGYAIYSTYNDLNNYYQGYNYMSGTSMAAPFVTGLAGLLLSQDPNRTPTDVTKLITATADKMGNSVYDPYFGYGRINVARSLAVGADIQWTQIIAEEQTGGLGDADAHTEATAEPFSLLYLPLVVR
jgi:subtilisin family serine protease